MQLIKKDESQTYQGHCMTYTIQRKTPKAVWLGKGCTIYEFYTQLLVKAG